jgi:hypothetical protein
MSEVPASRTVRQMISDVRQDLKSVNLDQWIPGAYIHRKLIDTAALFIKREADNMRLQMYPDIWVTVDDLVMEESTLIGAADIKVPNCVRVMKSVKELPRIFTTRFGYVLNVSSIDFSGDYVQTTPRDYNNKMNRRFQDPTQRYFWIYNNQLVIPNSFVKSLTLRALFANKADGLKLNGCGNPGCIRTLDQEFPAPSHLLEDIKKSTVIDIASIREKLIESEYPNLNQNKKVAPQAQGK